MEHILFAAAEQQELDCALDAFQEMEKELEGKIEVSFMLTGIGTTSTCYTLMKALHQAEKSGDPYSLIIDLGIAGSYDLEKFPSGSAAVISEEHFGDLGFENASGFSTLFQSKVWDEEEFPFSGGALRRPALPYPELEAYLSSYGKAVGVTVQTVTGIPEKVEALRNRFMGEIESMEGAAFYYVALQENVPFFELRTVSNAVGESDSKKWDTAAALATLSHCIRQILMRLLQSI